MKTGRFRALAFLCVAFVLAAGAPGFAAERTSGGTAGRTPVTEMRGSPAGGAPIGGWMIQSSQAVSATGAEISRAGFDDSGWYRVSRRSTVMAGLVEAGVYDRRDLFFSDNLRDTVDRADFEVPWWYRTELTVAQGRGRHTFLRFNGVTSRADVWFNGHQLADSSEVVGSYTGHAFDVTDLLRPGRNALAVRVYPADPMRDLSIWFLDWNPAPPDDSMGIWRDVIVERTRQVSLRDVHVPPSSMSRRSTMPR